MSARRVRDAARPVLRPVKRGTSWLGRWRRRARYLRDGIEGIAAELRGCVDPVPILREYGATVGQNASIFGPLVVVNADGDFSNLTIGDNVHIGAGTLVDLADRVTIEDYATVSMRCTLITHIDVGSGPLRERRPREQAPIALARGCYLGAGVTVLHGVTVGAEATVGAHALVRKDVPPRATVVGPDARLLE
jgi:acetyltransferase-like isoleucine patch superfamily enzyme